MGVGRGSVWVMDGDPSIMALIQRVFPRARTERAVTGAGKFTANPLCLSDTESNAADLKLILQRHPAKMSESDSSHLESRLKSYAEREQRLQRFEEGFDDSGELVLPLEVELRWYQQDCVSLVGAVGRTLVADDLGLGKSEVGIASCLLPGGLPAVVVAPTHLKTQWALRIQQRVPMAMVQVLNGIKTYDVGPADFYVTSHNVLHAWTEDIINNIAPATVVFDEVHEYRHLDTKKRNAAAWVSESARRVVGLSATPIFNFADEAYSVVDLISPGALGTLTEFHTEWGRHVSNPRRLGEHLRDHGLMIRHTAEEAGIHAGDKVTDLVMVDASIEELARVEKQAIALAKQTLTGGFETSGTAARQLSMLLRQATGVSKIVAVAEFVENLLQEAAPKVLVFCWHREVYSGLMHRLAKYQPLMYTGSETPQQKATAMRRFTTDPKCRVMLMSLRSGAGVDGLQKVCSHIVFAEFDWSPAQHAQCIGRLDRFGQEKPVYAYFVGVNDGSDPPIIDLLGLKKGSSSGVVDLVGGDEEVEEPVSRLQEVAMRYLEQKSALTFGDAKPTKVGLELAAWLSQQKLAGMPNEKALQERLEKLLEKDQRWAGRAKREVTVAPGSIIDFMVREVGIEVKVQGDRSEVFRQVARYAPHVPEIILLCPWPLASFAVGSTPVHVVCYNNNASALA